MRSHTFDAVSAALGLIAISIGLLVGFDAVDSIDSGWWVAMGALVVGVGLFPWTRTRALPAGGGGSDAGADIDPGSDGEGEGGKGMSDPGDPRTWRL